MTSVRILWLLLCLLWIGAEIKLARKTRLDNKSVLESEELSQSVLWVTIVASLGGAMIFKALAWLPIPLQYLPRQIIALLLFAAGLFIRYAAIGQLGRFFTTHVAIQNQHQLIIDGSYRWVRHPAYTGLLLALTAAGIAMGDVLAFLLLTAPCFLAFNFRIAIEEQMLIKKFGPAYQDYCKTTAKLLPWLF